MSGCFLELVERLVHSRSFLLPLLTPMEDEGREPASEPG